MTKIAKRKKVIESINKWWSKNRQSVVTLVTYFISYTFTGITLVGVLLYIFLRIAKTDAQPIEMAIVTALLGGITLAGGFIKDGIEGVNQLRRIGAIYIFATIAFLVFGFYVTIDGALPGDRDVFMHNYMVWVMGVTLYGGAIAFTLATTWLLVLLPKFFKNNKGKKE